MTEENNRPFEGPVIKKGVTCRVVVALLLSYFSINSVVGFRLRLLG